MNKKIKDSFFELEHPHLDVFVFIANGDMPVYETAESPDNTRHAETYNTIHQYVVAEKHFLDKDITVNIIVRQCGIQKKSLNKTLRQKEDVSFHGYINKQRIMYASTLLLDPSNKLIEVVASESGFNNSRTFVRNFKAVYSMTPSEYRRHLLL